MSNHNDASPSGCLMMAAGFRKSLGSSGDWGRWGREKTGSGRLKRLANFLSLGMEGTSSPDSHFL